MFTHISGKSTKPPLHNKKTDWTCFRETLDEVITLEIPPKTEIGQFQHAVENITKVIKKTAWQATPDRNEQYSKEERPIIIKQKIAEESKAHKCWQLIRASQDKHTTR
jgi:hypothetical protein